MKLVGFIEKEFEVKVPPEDIIIENFMDVEAIEKYLNK
jgi:acyl carrier protein